MKKLWKQGIGFMGCMVVMILATMTAFAATSRMDIVEDTYWDGTNPDIAIWAEGEEVYRYTVQLYRNDYRIAEVTTKKTAYDFSKYLVEEGVYVFRVKASSDSSTVSDSYWSQISDKRTLSEEDAIANQYSSDNNVQVLGPGSTDVATIDVVTGVLPKAQWIQDEIGWWYSYEDGSYPVDGWFQDPSTSYWYYFNEQGYMMTGWLQVDGINYYCNESGVMVNGTVVIDGVTQYFEQSGAWIPQS